MKLLAQAYTLGGDFQNAVKTYESYNALYSEMIEEERNNRSLSFDIEKRMAENERAVQLLETENKYSQKGNITCSASWAYCPSWHSAC